jgi:Domain of unknown function (DUF3472)/Domain of unknown function (DUF5077)
MKNNYLKIRLLALLAFMWTGHLSAQSQKFINTFSVPANKAYAEPFSPDQVGISIPVGYPETIKDITNWKNKDKHIAWYLYQKEGDYDFFLNTTITKGKSLKFEIQISPCYEDLMFTNIKKKITLKGTGKRDTAFVAQTKISKTGYYKYELIPISSPELSISLHSLIFHALKPNGQVNHTNYQSSPSVHLGFSTTQPTSTSYNWLYEEILVPEGADPLHTFYMAIGFYRGYFGIQTNTQNERRVLFSVWDSKDAEKDKSINHDDYVSLVDKADYTTVNSFGGEGTGGQSYVKTANWKSGSPVKFLMNVSPQTDYTVLLSAWYKLENEDWKYVATWKAPKEKRYFNGFHSFLENFGYSNGQLKRSAYYYNAWGYEVDQKKWVNFNKVRFSNTDGKEGQRIDYEQGVSPQYNDRFYMSSGGYTPTLKTKNEILISTNPPMLDLQAFEQRVEEAKLNEGKFNIKKK